MWPLALLWGLGAWIRNKLYDSGFLSSAEFEVPVISIGNLSMGGSGKTPHIEYFLYRWRRSIPLAVLSRGYRRRTTGFRIAQRGDNFEAVGDEPRQIKSKFQEVVVAVGENRALAIPNLLAKQPGVRIILLDDAFQHRSVKPALNILLTPYERPFWRDHLFPVGWLREARSNYKRADIIIVTKCPSDLDAAGEADLLSQFRPGEGQKIFFSTLRYDLPYRLLQTTERRRIGPATTVLLFTGIADGEGLRDHLEAEAGEVIWMDFDDHYNYEQRDLQTLLETYNNIEEEDKMIVTTEKDAVRLEPYRDFLAREQLQVYCLPVRVEFTGSNKDQFDNLVLEYLNYYIRPEQWQEEE
jgi:tetraacyldisaccharide 4'-kinase